MPSARTRPATTPRAIRAAFGFPAFWCKSPKALSTRPMKPATIVRPPRVGWCQPTRGGLTIVAGFIGLVLSAFGDLHQKAGNPKAARIALGVVAGLVLALGIYGIV